LNRSSHSQYDSDVIRGVGRHNHLAPISLIGRNRYSPKASNRSDEQVAPGRTNIRGKRLGCPDASIGRISGRFRSQHRPQR
jgi:hypothetical protein